MRLRLVVFFLMMFCCSYGQQKEALDYYNKGLAIEKKNASQGFDHFLRAVRLAEKDSELQFQAALKVAHYYNYATEEEKPEIIKWSLVGLNIVKKTHRNDTLAAHMFFRGGRAYELDFKPDSALLTYKETIKRYELFYGKNSGRVSDCYYLIGEVYKLLHDFDQAEKYYEMGLNIREKMKPDEVTLYMTSLLYSSLAEVNRKQREFDKALVYYLRNVAFAESIDYPSYLEFAYENLGDMYRDTDDYSKAIELYRKTIVINKKINHGTDNHDLASHYIDIAQTFQKRGAIKEAVINYSKGIQIFRSLKNVKDASYITGLHQLGELYLENDVSLAQSTFRQAISIVRQYQLLKGGYASGLYKSMAKSFAKVNQTDSALAYCQRALIATTDNFASLSIDDNPKLENIDLKDYAYDALLLKAKILSQLYHDKGQIEYANKSLVSFAYAEELLTLGRSELDTDQSKWNFFDSNFELYEQVISLLYDLNLKNPSASLVEKAFYYMESSKSKMLSDALNETEFTTSLIADDSLIHYLNSQRINLYHLQSEFKKTGDLPVEKEKRDGLRNSIIDADRKIQTAKNEIEKKYPSYAKIKYSNVIPSLKKITDYTSEQEASLLEYFWGYSKVYAIGLNEGGVSFKCLGSTDSVQSSLQPVLDFLQQKENSYSKDTCVEFANQSYSLFNTLVSPFSPLTQSEKKIIVIPDGPIGQFPMEAMTTSAPQKGSNFSNLDYLLNKYFISYTFSSSYLLNEKEDKLTQPRLLAFGFTGGRPLRSSQDIPDNELMGSEEELKSLERKFPEGLFHAGPEVTERRFKKEAPDFDFLHLAVHGQGDTEQNYSASLLFRDSVNSREDGLLHWYELFGMNLKARLVVISSCESGIGKTYRGEGMLSMASSFAYAGCRNIVMGLWKVDDRVSVQLMNSFYENIQAGKPVDESITLAKRSYLAEADELSANPKMWASLVTYGNDQVMEKRIPYLRYAIYILAAILVIGFLFLTKNRIQMK